MEVLKEYKSVFLSGIAVLIFLAVAYGIISNAEPTDSPYTYGEHIFQEGVVNEINIEIDEADWQDMLENPLEEEYHQANVTINGETISNIAIRTKGNNSLTSVASSDSDRYSFKIDFDYYDDNGNYYGLKKLCLNNNYGDSSNMREYISYQILEEMGVPVPGCGYSHITINGEEWGLYLAVETIDEVFLATHFEDATGDLYKPDGTGADLVYQGEDISVYTGLNLKTNEETSDGSEILALMRALESGEGLEDVLDVDEALRYLAANVALANYDSYLGGTTHNYYLYEENGVFTILPWDYNYSFGAFGGGEVDIYEPANNTMGGGGPNHEEKDTAGENDAGEKEKPQEAERVSMENDRNSSETENISETQMERNEDSFTPPEGMMGGPFSNSQEKPLVTTLLENEEYLARYEAYLKEIAETYFSEEYMAALVQGIHDLIAPYVEQDATAFYTYGEFEQASSVDSEDTYSLVYYAVNMAESILTQLDGGEPTFDVSSLQGGGMGGGKGGGRGDFDGEMPAMGQGNRRQAFEPVSEQTAALEGTEQPDAMTEQPEGGEGPDAMAEQEEQTEQPEDMGREFPGAGGERPNGMQGGPGGMGGERGMQQIDFKQYLPIAAVCGGIFIAGAAFLLVFKRKKELKPPKGN